jgi:hypothetical protein
MMQPRMHGAWIHQVSKSHLVYIPQPLVKRMRNDLKDQRMIYRNKTIYRVVDDLAYFSHCWVFVKGPERAGGKTTNAEVKKLFLKDYPVLEN